jgi:hypothetical protein
MKRTDIPMFDLPFLGGIPGSLGRHRLLVFRLLASYERGSSEASPGVWEFSPEKMLKLVFLITDLPVDR